MFFVCLFVFTCRATNLPFLEDENMLQFDEHRYYNLPYFIYEQFSACSALMW